MPAPAARVILLLLLVARPAAAQERPADTLAARADSLFAPWRNGTSPGCAAGVVQRGEVRFRRAYGMANLETGSANTPETVFLAASIAKQFTALSVLLLARQGRLSLDDGIRRFLPELPDYGTPITLRQLLAHTSGLRDFFEMLTLARGRFEEDRITAGDMLDIVTRQRALNFPPGTEFGYSNTGYALLALAVARVSGQPFPAFVDSAIFAPLGMSHTRVRDDYAALVPGRATGYNRRGETWRLGFPNYDLVGPTNLYTTVDDLLRWSENLAAPVVGDAAMMRQMMTRGVLANGDSTWYGFGLGLWTDHGAPVAEHEGSDPGYRAFLGRWPDAQLGVVVLCNARSIDAVTLGHRLASVYLGWNVGERQPWPRQAVFPADSATLAARAGRYLQPRQREVVTLTWREGGLWLGGRRLLPVGRDSVQIEGEPVLYVFDRKPHGGFTVTPLLPGRHPTRFEWRGSLRRLPAPLHEFAGTYASRELGAVYRVTARDSTLELVTGTSAALVAQPAFPDGFTIGQLLIQFTRSQGRITGFELSHPRARGLAFTRR